MKKNETICVLGLGYIGLPLTSYLAASGYRVIGVDINKKKIDSLVKGKLPFFEPGLGKLFKTARKNLKISLKSQKADIFIISVPTPITSKKKADLKFVIQAAKDINKVLNNENLVILESTVPPGTVEKVVLPILLKGHKNFKIYLSHAPERAIPGNTLLEMKNNDRIIGGIDKKSAFLAKQIYSSFVKGDICLTDAATSEFVKAIENTFRDINIAFANELAKLSDEIDVNVWEAIKLANLHPRVNIHSPGPGVGGHCIGVVPWFLINTRPNDTQAIKLARQINDSMPAYVIKYISLMLKDVKKPRLTILGVAYKANVDDWRETPALQIIKLAKNKKWQVKIHDPLVKNFPYRITTDFNEATEDSDCLVLITNHNFYKKINPEQIRNMRNKKIFDSRNFINKEKWQKAGFKVKILGDGHYKL